MARLDKTILLRVSEAEREQIHTDARTRHMSVNNYLRTVVLGYPTEQQSELELRVTVLEQRLEKLEKKR